jgi:hypothetical protein
MIARILVPTTGLEAGASLENWSERDWTDGVQLDELPDFACLLVRTTFSVYQLIVVNSQTGEVMVRGGKRFPAYTRSQLEGSSVGGSLLKRLGVYVGFSMELRTGRHRLLTSPVHSITHVGALA